MGMAFLVVAGCTAEFEFQSQGDALADGVVDEAEYRAAIESVVQCVRDRGFTADGPFAQEGEPLFLYFETAAAPGPEVTATDQAVEDCEVAYSDEVASLWAAQHYDPEEDLQFYAQILDCIAEETGDDMSSFDPANSGDLSRVLDEYGGIYHSCVKAAVSIDQP